MPRLLNPLTFSGGETWLITAIFFGSAFIPLAEKLCPKNSSVPVLKAHLSGFKVRWLSSSHLNTECYVMLLLVFSVNQNVVTDVDDSRNAVDDLACCVLKYLQQRMSRS